MQTEFYRSQPEIRPTFSVALAVSLAGLGWAPASPINAASESSGAIQPPLGRYAHVYYGCPDEKADQAGQMAAMRCFAERLLKETEETPQEVVEVLNRHFWDLV